MTRLPELHRLLVQGARRLEAQAKAEAESEAEANASRSALLEAEVSRSRLLGLALRLGAKANDRTSDVPPHSRRISLPLPGGLRASLLALVGLLLSGTIALAATGVIELGSPVRPERPPRPRAGIGAPVPSQARLLPLRTPDPAGGLPWGMRIVPTTRGEICLQIGRVEHRRLGELGIDGAFHDDGKFHPLPADDLPQHSFGGTGASYDTSCQLEGLHDVLTTSYARSAASVPSKDLRSFPRRDLREVSYGLLGPKALSVAYREGKQLHTERVIKGLGAYLVVQRLAPSEHIEPPGAGGGVSGSGEIIAHKPLTAINYRVDGRVCDRALGHMHQHGCSSPKAHVPRYLRGAGNLLERLQAHLMHSDMHKPLHTHLLISKGLITAVQVSFKAPFAVSSARAEYTLSAAPCRLTAKGPLGPRSGGSSLFQHDVRRGGRVSLKLFYPFEKPCKGRTITIEAIYRRGGRFGPPGEPGSTLVGTATIKQPPGTDGLSPSRHKAGP